MSEKTKSSILSIIFIVLGFIAGMTFAGLILKANGQVVQYSPFGWNGTTVTAPAGYSVVLPMQMPQFTASSTASTTGTLATSTQYFFEVAATDGIGTTTASNEQSFTTGTTTPSVILQWNAVPGAQKYQVYYATSSQAESYFITTTGTAYTFATTTAFTATSTPNAYTTAYAASLNASGTSQMLTGNVMLTGIVMQGANTSTCYKYVPTSTGTLAAATTTCL